MNFDAKRWRSDISNTGHVAFHNPNFKVVPNHEFYLAILQPLLEWEIYIFKVFFPIVIRLEGVIIKRFLLQGNAPLFKFVEILANKKHCNNPNSFSDTV